jgi:hypothetical protein
VGELVFGCWYVPLTFVSVQITRACVCGIFNPGEFAECMCACVGYVSLVSRCVCMGMYWLGDVYGCLSIGMYWCRGKVFV